MEDVLISSTVAIICAILSIGVTLILRKKDRERELHQQLQEEYERQVEKERQKLSLDIADDLLYDNEKIYIKITNKSLQANASNIVIDMRVEDIYKNVICEMRTLDLGRRVLLCQNTARETKESEVVLVYDLKHILPVKLAGDEDVEPVKSISDIIKRGNVIKVKMQAVNMELGIIDFANLKIFERKNIKRGTFVEGITTIQRPNQPTYIDNAIDN